MSTSPEACRPATRAVRAGIDSDVAHGAVVPPIVLSSNFSFAGFDRKRRYDYTRSGNPTRDQLADAIADLEGAAGGVVTATGLAACTLALALLEPDDLLVVPHDGYGGSWRLFTALARKRQFRLHVADLTDPRQLAAALALSPKLVWVETPSNPLLRVTDLRFVCEAAHRAGALVLADNTFLSPALQRPIEFGADLVLHSTTKYINGHSDVVGGALVARDPALVEQLTWWANALGLTGSPFDSFLTLRGLRTLDARLRVHQENALRLATEVQALAGGEPAARAFVDGLRCFTLAESLGGVESLVAHPATMTHAAMSAQARAVAGIGDGLLRLSVGIEHGDDLSADVALALERALSVTAKSALA